LTARRKLGSFLLGALPALGLAAAGHAARGFPPRIYPVPVAAVPGHAVGLCPSHRGLAAFTTQATKLGVQQAQSYARSNLETDLRNADRAWWPEVRRNWRTGRPASASSRLVALGSEPAAQSGYAVFLRPACGTSTLKRSLMVTIGPSQAGPGPHCNACNVHLFFIDRRGRPLVWFVY
jgi:hypothetical protein